MGPTVSFYEEIEAMRAHNDAALERLEKTCAGHARWLRDALQKKLGWPDAQIAIVDFDEPPEGARRVSGVGHVSRSGYHFGLKVAGPTDWHVVFYWTMRVLPSQKIELEGDPDPPRRTIIVDPLDASPDAAEPLAAYVRDKIRAFIDRIALATRVEEQP
jgi:hypothetical protein